MKALVAILAAGESRRMGKPKLCLPWEGTSILGYVIDQWRKAGVHDLLVVHAPGPETPVICELDRLKIPPSQRTATVALDRGMMGSVVTAARHAFRSPGLTHLIIALGDQPQIRPETLQALLNACEARPESILRVAHAGKPGHPLALPVSVLAELGATPCATLRDFIGLQPIRIEDLTCPDSGVLLDIDTPDDYAQAVQTSRSPMT